MSWYWVVVFFFVFFKREPKIFQHVDIRTEVTHHRKIEYIYVHSYLYI